MKLHCSKYISVLCLFIALVWADSSRKSISEISKELDDLHRPSSEFRIVPKSATRLLNLLRLTKFDPEKVALNHMYQQDLFPRDKGLALRVIESYKSSNGIHHVYLKQTYQDTIIFNSDLNVNIDAMGNVISYGYTVYKEDEIVNKDEQMSAWDILQKINKYFDLFDGKEILSMLRVSHSFSTEDSFTIEIEESNSFLALGEKTRTFLKKLQSAIEVKRGYTIHKKQLRKALHINLDILDNWLQIQLCASEGKVLAVNDWISDSKYKVFTLGTSDPSDGAQVVLEDPEDAEASPNGWVFAKDEVPYTRGNNVYAQANWNGDKKWSNKYRPKGPNNDFSEFETLTDSYLKTHQPHEYVDAAVVNLFYWNNVMHDILYKYGFNEEAGNFQESNFGKGGRANDAVIANAQDGEGMNNANFATPPDGTKPRMRMYLWDVESAKNPKDGDLDAGIIIHEYTHGASTRMTGGPKNSDCLYQGEAGGMGEGWGDFVALLLRMRPEYTRQKDFLIGSYVYKNQTIRNYPYSTSLRTNPDTYKAIKKWTYNEVHASGEVWAAILMECYWNLVDYHGFDPDWYNGNGGNNQMLRNVIEAMKIQPCNPTFVSARDAILQADEYNHEGKNYCLLWTGFAKRGLGINAKKGGIESMAYPLKCKTKHE